MAFWSKKKLFDVLKKGFKNDNISTNEDGGKISFELYFSEAKFNVYPYIVLDEDNSIMSIKVNIRKIEKENIYEKLNSFNLKSKYFTAKIRDDIVFLEYNVLVESDNVYDILKCSINSLTELQFEIDMI